MTTDDTTGNGLSEAPEGPQDDDSPAEPVSPDDTADTDHQAGEE